MTDDSQTGPWALALGTLAVGVGAVAAEVLRRRRDDPEAERGAPADGR